MDIDDGGSADACLALLEKAQKLIEVERSLTAKLEKVEPWLASSSPSATATNEDVRVRPIPTTIEQVEAVLAVGRVYASRTSAPAGWNPNAPVVGFSTPNPLPHQLRGGALASLQLDKARQSENDKKRRRQVEEEEEKAQAAKKSAESETTPSKDNRTNRRPAQAAPAQQRPRAARAPQQQVPAATMNLSDSSSSSEDEEDSD